MEIHARPGKTEVSDQKSPFDFAQGRPQSLKKPRMTRLRMELRRGKTRISMEGRQQQIKTQSRQGKRKTQRRLKSKEAEGK